MLQQPRPGVLLCLDRVGECERLAELAGDPRSKETYIHIASQWQTRPASYEHIIGDCLVELGLDDQAEAAYRRVADLQPEMPESWMGLCRLRLLQGNGGQARNIWLENRDRYSNFELAEEMGAEVEFFTHHFDQAHAIYSKLVHNAPDGGGSLPHR